MCDKYCDCNFCVHRDDEDFCGQMGDGSPLCHFFRCDFDCDKIKDCITSDELFNIYDVD